MIRDCACVGYVQHTSDQLTYSSKIGCYSPRFVNTSPLRPQFHDCKIPPSEEAFFSTMC